MLSSIMSFTFDSFLIIYFCEKKETLCKHES
jgi:hypothetical protein